MLIHWAEPPRSLGWTLSPSPRPLDPFFEGEIRQLASQMTTLNTLPMHVPLLLIPLLLPLLLQLLLLMLSEGRDRRNRIHVSFVIRRPGRNPLGPTD